MQQPCSLQKRIGFSQPGSINTHVVSGHMRFYASGKHAAQFRQTQAPRLPVLASAAPATSPALASSLSHLLSPEPLFSFTSALMVPVYGVMIFAPQSKLTRRLVQSPALLLLLGALYTVLLVQAMQAGLWQTLVSMAQALQVPPHTPDMTAVARLFCSPVITALAWVHLLMLDFFQAREVLVDGLVHSVATGHSVALCFLFGPLGLMSHMITRALSGARAAPSGEQGPGGQGSGPQPVSPSPAAA
mmetsp:Transcript_30614/g.67800  ORF Transcript_30614/g.67800 Transcript_30614/m.67800 type:complete len:245 (+) Transcript_30614:110-844(+)|eukprot:CAMPEP_0202904558 /NCGR_PEP_ID=MMETSP1392-20130828/29999_1 /ASSEMBLY_ACC=CAM_ASM_000868 /TAXON_ID=225041 /ORGANISM="Chlamydomonas chlamydogama, Strain SAG 11-48b" /LENGTH=244 /DNA_ID=CAMNT_0049592229 /DNA_START=65 /DNA_END=799 /DNA_ORIENTATION=+